ncbi:MAG: hypothetical protein K6L75_06500 [Cellvibrionaceae bacterium]
MYLNNFSKHTLLKKQQGWLMPMAAFIVVVMGLLAVNLSRIGTQSSFTRVQEQVSIQAFFTAESVAQFAMNQLFYSTSSTISRTYSTNACSSVNGDNLSFSAAGMNGCTAIVSCTASVDGADSITFYEIQSRAQCGVEPIWSERTVTVKAFLE